MYEIMLINVSGPDRPGVTAALTGILAECDVVILDIGQSVIHEILSLGLLVKVPASKDNATVQKELLFAAHQLALTLRFTPITDTQYAHWVGEQGKPRHLITLLGRQLSAAHMAQVAGIVCFQDLNIDVITRLSGRIPLDDSSHTRYACVEFSVRGTPRDANGMRRAFLEWTQQTGIDVALQEDDIYRRTRRLVAFDMDSTLIDAEVIVELARKSGVGEEVAAITEASMRGELDFRQSLLRRVALLRGLSAGALPRIAERLPMMEGAERLVGMLKSLGFKTAILSGGFSYFGRYLQNRLGVDYVFANELEIEDGILTGRLVGDIVDGPGKATCLRQIARHEGISLRQTIAVGDGANDLPMLSIAGLGIAFRAKPVVKESAQHALSGVGLDGILYLIGVRDREALSTSELQQVTAG